MDAIETSLGIGFFGVVIGYFIKYFLEYRQSKRLEELNKKRKVYEDAVESLGVFLSNRGTLEEQQVKFTNAYSSIWLWAPDDVVKAFSDFLQIQINFAESNNNVDQDHLKMKDTKCVIEMRKDLGFPKTSLTSEDYKFVSFN